MPPPGEPAFSDLLRRYRVGAGLTQEALAERARLSARAVSALESGARRAPYRETVRLLAEALGLGAPERDALAAAALRPRARPSGASRESRVERPESGVRSSGFDSGPPTLDARLVPGLPAALTSFVGRAAEVAALARIVSGPAVHLVTLTGAGGCGKTRLALEVARAASPAFAGGARLVELAAVTEAAFIAQAIAAALDVREEPGVPLPATLQRALAARHLLLVLDNCEHLIDACAELAAHLLQACPNLCILATSREPLRIPGERQWPVAPLAVPAAGTSGSVEALAEVAAVQLFVERARARRPGFELTRHNAEGVARICRRLDGLPLAIELAAARVTMISVEEIAARLDDRFRLLVAGSRTALPRQQTLRATIDWSYDLLSAEERQVFNRLSVFAGSFALDAAEAVCEGVGSRQSAMGERPPPPTPPPLARERGAPPDRVDSFPIADCPLPIAADVLDLLGRLVEKSLVAVEEQRGELRYRLLETIRQYSAERLAATAEASAAHRRHLDWYLALAERAEPGLAGLDQDLWLTRLDLEHDNLLAALEWSRAAGEVEAGLRLAGALWRFWTIRGHLSAGRHQLQHLVETADCRDGNVSPRVRARALNASGNIAIQLGAYREAAAHWEEGFALWREIGDTHGLAAAINNLGTVATNLGDFKRAVPLYEESLGLYREVDDNWGIANALANLALCASGEGDNTRAAALLEESLVLRRWLGDKERIAESLNILGRVVRSTGDPARAEALHTESLRLRWEVGDRTRIPYCLEGLAAVAVIQGQLPRAARLFGAAEALRTVTGSPVPPSQRADYEHSVAAVRAGLAAEAFAAAWREGSAMPPEAAVSYALRDDESASGC